MCALAVAAVVGGRLGLLRARTATGTGLLLVGAVRCLRDRTELHSGVSMFGQTSQATPMNATTPMHLQAY